MGRKLTNQDVAYIKLFGKHARVGSLAEEYGVHPCTIRNILKGDAWHGSPAPRRDRNMTYDEVCEMRKLSREGLGEHAIKNRMKSPWSRSSIRQVIKLETYKDIPA